MLNVLHALPLAAGIAAVCAAFLLPTLLGCATLQPRLARMFRGERDINTVLGFVLNALALYFGVLIALLSIAVYENYNKAHDAVDREASSIVRLYRDLRQYPEPLRKNLLSAMHSYVEDEIGPGWEAQQRGRIDPQEMGMMNDLRDALGGFEPSTPRETVLHAQTLRSFADFTESRRARIAAGAASVPHIMWYVVLAGAVMNIVVIWLFDLRRSTHAIVGGTIALFISLVIYMIAILDEPFRGRNGIRPEAIAVVHEQSGLHQ